MRAPRIEDVDLSLSIKDKDAYEKELKDLQIALLRLQQSHYHGKRRAIIVFEGWDAAGKGGAIRRLTERIDPRGAHVWSIAAPTAEEQAKHYLYRFWQKLPSPGTWAIFDRSWYGRVMVERVEGFAKKEAWNRAYDEINGFERMMHDDGVAIVKLFLHISKKEQLERFHERENNPYKNWKITDEDWRNRKRWKTYVAAADEMFARTSTKRAPWTLISAEKKWYARISVLRAVVKGLSKA